MIFTVLLIVVGVVLLVGILQAWPLETAGEVRAAVIGLGVLGWGLVRAWRWDERRLANAGYGEDGGEGEEEI